MLRRRMHRPGRIGVTLRILTRHPSPRREESFSHQRHQRQPDSSSLFQAVGDINLTETNNGNIPPFKLGVSINTPNPWSRRLTNQNKASVSYTVKGGESPSDGVAKTSELIASSASDSRAGENGGAGIPSNSNLLERSWKSELRLSTISSNAARWVFTKVKEVEPNEVFDAPLELTRLGGINERRIAVPPLFP